MSEDRFDKHGFYLDYPELAEIELKHKDKVKSAYENYYKFLLRMEEDLRKKSLYKDGY